mgnify:CR=1
MGEPVRARDAWGTADYPSVSLPDFCICLQIGCSNKYAQEGDGKVRATSR